MLLIHSSVYPSIVFNWNLFVDCDQTEEHFTSSIPLLIFADKTKAKKRWTERHIYSDFYKSMETWPLLFLSVMPALEAKCVDNTLFWCL